jgi:hypothetical protein
MGFGVILALSLWGLPVDSPKTKPETVTITGKVVALAEALQPYGLTIDPEPEAQGLVVQTDGGAIVPLLADENSRALFKDSRLRHRAIEIKARRFAGLPHVQVVTFRVREHGRWRTPEYFCEVCTISVRYPQVCPCCQGPMELRMKPEEP